MDPTRNLIVIGGSAGAQAALRDVTHDLGLDIPATIIVLVHRWGTRLFDISASLQRTCRLPVLELTNETLVREGMILIVPPGKTGVFGNDSVVPEEVDADDYPHESINQLFLSAANVYKDRVIGVILTGMLKDGTTGLRAVAQAGGLTIVQADAKHPGMPINAREDWPVTFSLNLSEIGATLDLLSRRKFHLETGVTVAVRLLNQRLALLVRLLDQSKSNESTTRFLEEEVESLRDDLNSVQALLPRLLR